jgi:hypothetical protein
MNGDVFELLKSKKNAKARDTRHVTNNGKIVHRYRVKMQIADTQLLASNVLE